MAPLAPVQIALVLCLRADPAICREPVPIVLEQPPTLMECITGGQQYAAAWMNEHPQFADYFARLTCSWSGMRDGSVG